MLTFRMRAAVVFGALVIVTACCAYVSFRASALADPLLPREQSAFAWHTILTSDSQEGGTSSIQLNDAGSTFNFDFVARATREYPYVAFAVNFAEYFRPVSLADWSRYDRLRMTVSCRPANVLNFVLYTYDDKITDPTKFGTYRNPATFFSCGEEPRDVQIDLTRLAIPEWWFRQYGVHFSDRGYRLDKVLSFALHNSMQSPTDVASNVRITAATLDGHNWNYLYAALAFNVLVWAAFIYWYVRRKTQILIAEITEKILQERPLIAYQQLPVDVKEDDEKNQVMRYIATHYSDPELNVEMAVADLGINRAKINAVLKDELGLTFVSYLSKIRLTEAARLLVEKDVSVAEIAYSVGYNNASYFNTVFKKEYGVTPKTFQKQMLVEEAKHQ